MTEVQFAKQFLTTLDSKATKYESDHVFNPQTFQTRLPYTLPKLSHPPHPVPTKPDAHTPAVSGPESAITIDVTLKSSRNPNFTLHLPSLPSTTTISTLRLQVQSLLSQSQGQSTAVVADKIKILHNKKPIPTSKSTINDVLADVKESNTNVEFGVMVMGGAADPTPTVQTLNLNNEIEPSAKEVGPESEKAAAEASEVHKKDSVSAQADSANPVQPGEISGRDVLKTKEFWDDLQGFLEQRLRSSEVAVEVRGLFEKAAR